MLVLPSPSVDLDFMKCASSPGFIGNIPFVFESAE